MFDRRIPEINYKNCEKGKVVFTYNGIHIREGEIVGIFGIAGNGQLEVLEDILFKRKDKIFDVGNFPRYFIAPKQALISRS